MFRRFTSPLQKISRAHHGLTTVETIEAYAVSPWEERIEVLASPDQTERWQRTKAIQIATGTSVKHGRVGAGGSIQDIAKEEQ